MSRRSFSVVPSALLTGALLCLVPQEPASGQDAKEKEIVLPSETAAWLNSPPLTKGSLKGKCVAFWFYEEQCPNCRAKWPEMIALAKKFEKQPVVFVAVNSGNDAATVGQYVKGVELDWPVIVDTNRQFESQWVQLWGGTPISLSNVNQVAFLTRDGRQQSGRWYDVEGSAKKAIAGRVDPKVIPGALAPTWKQIQAGQYAAALPGLKKGLGASNPEIKNAAEFALDYAESKMREWATQADRTRKDGKAWEAYKLYASLGRAFNGYTFPEEIKAAQKELLNDEQVKKQLDAQKALDALKKTFPGVKTEVQKKKAAEKLKDLATTHADTEAATEVEQILKSVEGRK